ncbi:ADP-ribose pyrophosphatase [hydrothermal vent metagenome]|uniref:ADP-ribose pyrophosphatase n=1 Tax=hydrothermal vent metagenome TaxID=652676 RepID=A0A3B1CGB8_9ZZZZ
MRTTSFYPLCARLYKTIRVKKLTVCPSCGAEVAEWKNPKLTVDIIIEVGDKIVLIERANEPFGFALPGGFVDYGESLENAAVREAKEETGLDVKLKRQLGAYSDPKRDPRQHNVSVVFLAAADGAPIGADDAKCAALFSKDDIPALAFDHDKILADYYAGRENQPCES